MDSTRFQQACMTITGQDHQRYNIGTYQEKSVHAVLKQYFQPDSAYHEQKVNGFVADICCGEDIYEIQTGKFYTLKRKLDAYLDGNYKVIVVYPIAITKWVSWIDAQTGEITERRKSPKHGRAADAFGQLYQIREYLLHPGLQICLMLMEVEEFRILDGYGKAKKRRGTRFDKVPIALEQELWLRTESDYEQLIPEMPSGEFTARDFAKTAHIPLETAQYALLVLRELQLVHQNGKQGRANLYCRTVHSETEHERDLLQ